METLSRVSYGRSAAELFFKFTGVSGVLENKGEKAVKTRLGDDEPSQAFAVVGF